jgi:hypothetical protein
LPSQRHVAIQALKDGPNFWNLQLQQPGQWTWELQPAGACQVKPCLRHK